LCFLQVAVVRSLLVPAGGLEWAPASWPRRRDDDRMSGRRRASAM